MNEQLRERLEAALADKIIDQRGVTGGCIANASLLELVSGERCFLKTMNSNPAFLEEANGLKELQQTNTIRVPDVIHVEEDFLLLEYIGLAPRSLSFMQLLGEQMAALHRYRSEQFSDQFGFYEDNLIGATNQVNLPAADWPTFYWQNRLLFQFNLAEQNGYMTSEMAALIEPLEEVVMELLKSDEKPALLHGDLWSGNVIADEKGEPCIIDPAVYYGHREAEFGMICLFPSFDREAHRHYNLCFPLAEGFDYRLDIYKLYHLLNHLNLFGSSYYHESLSIMRKYCQ